MVTCQNCGNKGMFLKTMNCRACGKDGCSKCMTRMFTVIANKEGWFIHRGQCFDLFVKRIADSITPADIGPSLYAPGLPWVAFINKIVGTDGTIDNIDDELRQRVEMAGEKVRQATRAEMRKKYGLSMEEAERIAIDFVRTRLPDATGGMAGKDVSFNYDSSYSAKSAQRHGKGWLVVVERVFTFGGYSVFTGSEASVTYRYWRVIMDEQGNVTEYQEFGPHTERRTWQRPVPSEIHLHTYEHDKDEEEDY